MFKGVFDYQGNWLNFNVSNEHVVSHFSQGLPMMYCSFLYKEQSANL